MFNLTMIGVPEPSIAVGKDVIADYYGKEVRVSIVRATTYNFVGKWPDGNKCKFLWRQVVREAGPDDYKAED